MWKHIVNALILAMATWLLTYVSASVCLWYIEPPATPEAKLMADTVTTLPQMIAPAVVAVGYLVDVLVDWWQDRRRRG